MLLLTPSVATWQLAVSAAPALLVSQQSSADQPKQVICWSPATLGGRQKVMLMLELNGAMLTCRSFDSTHVPLREDSVGKGLAKLAAFSRAVDRVHQS
jgi:hypothetical protein